MKKKTLVIAAISLAALMILIPAAVAADSAIGGGGSIRFGTLTVYSNVGGATVSIYNGDTGALVETGTIGFGDLKFDSDALDYSVSYYTVVVSKSGYDPSTTTVSGSRFKGSDYSITLNISPTSSKGYLYVESTPSGTVYIDGSSYGTSPVSVSLSPGSYYVRVVKNGYDSWSKNVTITSGNTTKIYPTLTPETTYGYVAVSSNPSSSNVYVDGTYKGTTPITITLSTGNHTLKLTKSGYTGFTKTITVYEGATSSVYGVLAKEETNAYVNISSKPVGASVYIDGTYLGTTPSSGSLSQTVTANETHTLQVRASGYDTFSTQFNLVTGEIRSFSPTLTASQPTTAFVNISSVPSGASVYIDSTYVGTTPISQTVDAGTHTIKLASLGYNDYTTTMSFTAGQSVNLPVTMTPGSTPTPSSSPFPVLGLLIGLGAAAVFAGKKLRR